MGCRRPNLTVVARISVLLAFASGCRTCALKPLPEGLSYRGEMLPASNVRFLSDRTYLDETGERRIDQQIFDEVFAMIARAERLVVVDAFLFNEFLGKSPPPHRRLCEELTEALLARKRAAPGLRAVLITDPINTVYGGCEAAHLKRLEEAGIEVTVTRLDRLRDSNPIWSCVWRLLIRPWGNHSGGGWLPSPFGGGEVTLRSWLALLNFKANHRKVVVADDGGDLRALVTSANPHDGSSAHSNVAVAFTGPAARAVLETEQAVLDFSGGRPPSLREATFGLAPPSADPRPCRQMRVQVLTEAAIADAAEAIISEAEAGDALDLVMFYLADRRLIRDLKAAARRGVALRVILDPNKDAFGREKDGIPNRQVAGELVAAGISVRWAVTSGEQMHTKMLLVKKRGGTAELLAGSANFTRRNVRDYNLETDVRIAGCADAPALRDAAVYVDGLWTNAGGCTFTAGYDAFRDDLRRRVFWYRLQEATGLCTW